MTLKILWVIGAAVFTAGCSTLDAEKCQRFDWYGLGREHGAEGADPDGIEHYARRCAEFGVSAERGAYARGHALGVSYYCTIDTAYGEGRVDEPLQTRICHAQDWSRLEYAWTMGKEYYRAQRAIEDLQEELDDAQRQRREVEAQSQHLIDAPGSDALRDQSLALIRTYEREELRWREREWELAREIRDAERQLDRLETYHRRELLDLE